jgi:hypothetical protein
MLNSPPRWAEYWHEEAKRLQKIIDDKQQVDVTPSSLLNNSELISDLARFAEGIVTQQAVRKKWRKLITDEMWDTFGSNDQFVEAIEAERARRTRLGARAREQAQQAFEKCPPALEKIIDDKDANPRHVVEASRELRAIANVGPEAQPTAERYHIVINLGADKQLVIDQPIKPTPIDVTPPKWIEKDDERGEPI